MANQIAPFGLSPVGTITGAPYNEQGRLYALQNDSVNTYAIGDVVQFATGSDTNGVTYVTKYVPATGTPVGVIVGIRVADPSVSLQGIDLHLSQNYLPLNSGPRYVYVVDDPNVIFAVQCDSTAITSANLHQNATLTVTANQTTLSPSSPQSNTVATGFSVSATDPLLVLGTVQIPGNLIGAYALLLVKWNKHQFFGGQAGA